MIDLSPRTDDRLRYSTKSGTFSSKFFTADWLKHSKSLNDEHTKSLHSPIVPRIFPQKQKSFPSVLSKRVFSVFLRRHSKSAQKKPGKHKKISCSKIPKEIWFFFPKRSTCKQTRDLLASQNGWQLIKILTTAVISNWLDMEQFNFVNVSLYNNKSLSTQSVTKSKLAKYQVG